jgi:hypothetical protein
MTGLPPRDHDDGTTNSPLDSTDIAIHMAIAAFTGIAWANVIELNLAVYMIFKRKRGLYFWSVVLCIQGIALHSLGFLLKLYGVVSLYQVTITIVTIGWYLMVTGQSLVLYSRLHLVVSDTRIVRAVLCMIAWNAVTLHIPTTVLTYGTNSPSPSLFQAAYRIMEKIQMTIFCLQELIISSLYIWATLRFLRPFYRRRIRSVMLQLFWINVGIILMDIAMVTVEYLGFYSLEVAMKAAIYSVKLKVEFVVLNQLMRVAKSSRDARLGRSVRTADDDPSDPSDPGSHSLTGAGGGIRGFIRRILPHSHHGTHDGRPGAVFIGDDDAMHADIVSSSKKANNAPPPHGNMSIVSAHRFGGDDHYHQDTPNMHGISVTREVTQVTKQIEEDLRAPNNSRTNKPTSYYPGSRHSNEGNSLEMVIGDGVGSEHSQLELVDLPPSAGGGSGGGSGHSSKVQILEVYETGVEDTKSTTTTVPKRAAQPSWKSRPSPTVHFRSGEPDYYQ